MRRRIIAACLCALSMSQVPEAHAQFGSVVFDPANFAENVATAAHTLRSLNNQIRQLQNEADMILNQIENLKTLDANTLSDLTRILNQIDALMQQGEDISYNVAVARQRYEAAYPRTYVPFTNQDIAVRAHDQWLSSQRAFGHAIEVQSGIVNALVDGRQTLSTLVTESQAAPGNLAVSQAGNQLMALSVEQQMQTQQLMAAQYRMVATEQARQAAREEQSRILHERFRGARSAYTRQGG